MKEEKLINQIKSLQAIRPSQEWVLRTERNILGPEKRRTFSFSWTPALASLATVVAVLAGVAGYYYFPRHQQVAEAPKPEVKAIASLAPSLENLKTQIDHTSTSLKQLPATASLPSEKKEVIKQAVKTSQKIMQQLQSLDEDKVLASKTAELETASQSLMTAFTRHEVERLFQQKEKGLLSPSQEEKLMKINDLLNEGRGEEAFNELLILENEK